MCRSNPDIVYAGTQSNGIYKSTNGGASWAPVNGGLKEIERSLGLAVDPSSPDNVYSGNHEGDVYKTTDGGDNWQPARRGLGSAALDTVVIDPVHPNILSAATDSGIFQSLDGGQDWNELSSGITNESMSRIALNPSDTRSIYVSTVGSGVIQQQIRKPEIFSVNFEKKNLSIKGRNFERRNFGGISLILINNSDRSGFLVQGADGEIKLNGKAKKLKLKSGNNTIQVIRSDGRQSNTFTMTF